MIRYFLISAALLFSVSLSADNSSTAELTLMEFVRMATAADPEFQKILIDQHYLKYRKDLGLPSSDLVLSVTGEYDLFLDEKNRNGTEGSVSLSKLFPSTGTEVSAEYSKSLPYSGASSNYSSAFTMQVSQPIARNALGRGTRILGRKLDVENSLARYQVVEAYEDYLSVLISLYIDWYAAHENVITGREIEKDSNVLYSLIIRKRRYRIAHPEDVSKGKLQVLTAREELVGLEDEYSRIVERISAASGLGGDFKFIPVVPDSIRGESEKDFPGKVPSVNSRTFMMLDLLKKKGVLARDIAKDNLLPSASLFAGYSLLGRDYRIGNPERLFFFGVSSELNIGRQKENAESAIADLDLKKTEIINRGSVLTLSTDIKVLAGRIRSEIQLIKLSQEKIGLSRAIAAAEQRKFTIGRSDLNDLIDARRQLNLNRYSLIQHQVLLQKLLVEWKRLTDTLVKKRVLER